MMKIQVLLENTSLCEDLKAEHGLSLYIETDRHKILFDMGQTTAFADNAEKLGIDLSQVDIAILSHGHYDHGGGLRRFMEINHKAPIYLNCYAFLPYYNGTEKYIGLDQELKQSERFVFVEDNLEIEEGITLCSCNHKMRPFAFSNFGLQRMEQDSIVADDFRHEQYLLLYEEGKKVVVSGCSHKGILNIMSWLEPDVLIGGFHLVKLDRLKDEEALRFVAEELKKYPASYYTGHCTGPEQYAFLKEILGEQLEYMRTGMEISDFI